MRLIPVLTAIVVIVVLYFLVFERDDLIAFARGGAAADAAQSEDSGKPVVAEQAAPAEDQAPAVGVVVQRSAARIVDSAIIVRGETQAARQVEVRAETTSTVISEPMRKGAFVQKGDLLCKLDPGTRGATLAETRARLDEAKSRVPEAKARLEEAIARLEEAKINYNAASKLSQDGYASETRLVSTQAEVRAAEAGIATAKAGLTATQSGIESAAAAVAAAQREIDRLTIVAPFEGLLESDAAELGSLMQPGSLCATIIQLDPIKLVGFIPETAVNRIEVGTDAAARLVTGAEVRGNVTFLSRSADPTTRTFQVEVTVPNSELKIRDGQTATIAITADGAKAHRLPQSALTLNNEGRLGVRVVGEDKLVKFYPVEMLRDDASGLWLGGLPETVDVIVVGQDFVVEGVRVEPTIREAAQ